MSGWLLAFGLTLGVEVPVYLALLRTAWRPRLCAALGTSALTHPYVWFILPPALVPVIGYWGYVALAELLVVATEAGVCVCLGSSWQRAGLVALAANSLSFGLGLLLLH